MASIRELNPHDVLEKCSEGSKPTSMGLFVREAMAMVKEGKVA